MILTNYRSSSTKTAVLDTGISDHNKTIFSILKHTFAKGPPKTICYRHLKNFDKKAFMSYLESKMSECPNSFKKFLQIFQNTVQLFTPLKKKIIYYNNKAFMTKGPRKAIMTRSKLRNKYNKSRTPENWTSFKKQRKKCVENVKCKRGLLY